MRRLTAGEIDLEKGITKVRALEQCGDQIQAMLIDGENTVVSDPNRAHCEHALKALEHLVVIDIFLTENCGNSPMSFYRPHPGQKQMAYSPTRRDVFQRVRAAVSPQGEARPDWWIVCEIAKRMGLDGFDFDGAEGIF